MTLRKILLILAAAVTLSLPFAFGVRAAPGTPTLRVTPTSNGFELYADNIGSPGAESWDLYFTFDTSVATISSVTPGPAFTSLAGCGTFNTTGPTQFGSNPNGYVAGGGCSTTPPSGVVGSNVLVATFTFSQCPQNLAINLDTGVTDLGGAYSQMSDPSGDPYVFTDTDLTDGTACSVPNAVTLESVAAHSTPVSGRALFAGVAALAGIALVGAGLAARRRTH